MTAEDRTFFVSAYFLTDRDDMKFNIRLDCQIRFLAILFNCMPFWMCPVGFQIISLSPKPTASSYLAHT